MYNYSLEEWHDGKAQLKRREAIIKIKRGLRRHKTPRAKALLNYIEKTLDKM